MNELFHGDYTTVCHEGDVLELLWSKQEPTDDHAVLTAREVVKALDAHFAEGADSPVRVLVDVSAVTRPYPRGTASYARWLVENRSRIRAVGIVATSFLVRTALTAAVLVPGLRVKTFSDRSEARAYLDASG